MVKFSLSKMEICDEMKADFLKPLEIPGCITSANAFFLTSDDRFCKLKKYFKDRKGGVVFILLLEKHLLTTVYCTAQTTLHKTQLCSNNQHASCFLKRKTQKGLLQLKLELLAQNLSICEQCSTIVTARTYLASIQVSKQAVNVFIEIAL